MITGNLFDDSSQGATATGTTAHVDADSADPAWASYGYGIEDHRSPSGLAIDVSEVRGSYWVGLANYGDGGCWEWHGPFTGDTNISFWHDGGELVSDSENIYWTVLVEGDGGIVLESSRVYTRDPDEDAIITTVYSEELGANIAVRVTEPVVPRYEENGAPVVVLSSGWFAGVTGFNDKFDFTDMGTIDVTYLWPGTADDSGAVSGGDNDYLGPDSIVAMREAIRFACGEITDTNGDTIDDLTSVSPALDNVGIYASSHPGVAATNVLAYQGEHLGCVRYMIGRENPTRDEMYPLEIGHWDEEDGHLVTHPFYEYPDDYSPTMIEVDYSSAGWDISADHPEGRPTLTRLDGSLHVMGSKGPRIEGVRYFSRALTKALQVNEVFGPGEWPRDLATYEATMDFWPYRVVVDGESNNYDLIRDKLPTLNVMLLFAADDHVQTALDKAHVHHAFDGFMNNAGFWLRMNPDLSYMELVNPDGADRYTERDANIVPDDWSNMRPWGYPNDRFLLAEASAASVAEMADRVQHDNWESNLDAVLVE